MFNLKKNALLDDITKKGIFGKVVAAVHVVEFQVSFIVRVEKVIKVVRTLYERVKTHMIHGRKRRWIPRLLK